MRARTMVCGLVLGMTAWAGLLVAAVPPPPNDADPVRPDWMLQGELVPRDGAPGFVHFRVEDSFFVARFLDEEEKLIAPPYSLARVKAQEIGGTDRENWFLEPYAGEEEELLRATLPVFGPYNYRIWLYLIDESNPHRGETLVFQLRQ